MNFASIFITSLLTAPTMIFAQSADDSPKRSLLGKVKVQRKNAGNVQFLKISPNGKTVAVSGFYCGVTLFDIASRHKLHHFVTEGYNPIDFSPDGTLLACGNAFEKGSGGTLHCFDLKTYKEKAWLDGRFRPTTVRSIG